MTRSSLGFFIFVFLLIAERSLTQSQQAQRRSAKAAPPSSTSASQVIDFDCPEEFGYYPHPSDCTQYYVCVFGGALLESCTGGLMYSHELQTCDWPRNVGCGAGAELVSTVSSVKSPEREREREPRPRQQLRQQQQQQQLSQQFPPAPQRQLQREEAIPKHHLYTEEDLGPAEEVESDRQQRVYRGQPATLGQVARDRDGLNRHSNALQVAPATGREKLSVISFGTQQQYRTESDGGSEELKLRNKRQAAFSRQSIAPPAYVEQTTTQRVTSRGYNSSQQQQYTPSPYDPYYNIYEDDADLYKDIDYSQYTGQQNHQYQPQAQPPPAYKEKPAPAVQQPSRKPSVQYSPPPPQPSYNTVQQDVYAGVQDYNDNYNLQDEDIDYKQSDLDLKGNRSRTSKRHETTTKASEAPTKTEAASPPRNRQLTLTAAFTFDNDKTPVTSSRQRTSTNSFQVEDPPSSGPIRDTHDLVLSYIRQENSEPSKTSESDKPRYLVSTDPNIVKSQTEERESQPRIYPKPFSLASDDSETRHIYSTSPSRGTRFFNSDDSDSRPFRIIVPSSTPRSTYEVDVDQINLRSRLRPGIRQQSTTPNGPAEETVKPYKLPPLNRESIQSLPIQQGRYRTAQKEETNQSNKVNQNNVNIKRPTVLENESIKFIPITPQRAPSKTTTDNVFRPKEVQNNSHKINRDERIQEEKTGDDNGPSFNEESIHSRNANAATRTGYSSALTNSQSSLADIPSRAESIVKLIPIQAMRSNPRKPQSTVNENVWPPSNRGRDISSGQPKKTSSNFYQVTEEISDFPHLTANENSQNLNEQTSVESNNKYTPAERLNKRVNYDSLATQRTPQRIIPTTEKSAKNSLYSLRIDKNNGKYIGNVDGLVVATLETITNKPESKTANDASVASTITENRNKQEESNIEYSEVNAEEKSNNNQNEEQNTNNAGKNISNNQVRIRIRGRQPTEANIDIYSTTTEQNENDPAIFVRSRNHIKQNNNRLQYSSENSDLKEAEPKRTETLSPVVVENVSRGVKSSEPTRETANYNLQNDDITLNSRRRQKSNLESKIEEAYNYNTNANEEQEINHRRRQLNNKNRLSETASNSDIEAKEIKFNSEEETFEKNNQPSELNENQREKVLRYYESPNKNDDRSRGTKTWHPDSYSLTEEDDQSDDEIKQEREFNIRKMHIRKKVRVTTSEPEVSTQGYDVDTVNYRNTKNPTGQLSNVYSINDGDEVRKKESATIKQNLVEPTSGSRYRSQNNERNNINRENRYQSGVSEYTEGRRKENLSFTAGNVNLRVDPYSLVRPSGLNDNTSRSVQKSNEEFTNPARRPSAEHSKTSENSTPFIAEEINSYFKQLDISTPPPAPLNVTSTEATTVPYVMTTVERIRDKFRLGSFPKPSPPTNAFARKPSVEDNTPPPLPSDRCSQELDNESECNENTRLRVRPTNASPDSQSTPGLTRGSSRNRGSATYTVSPNEAEPPNRGTPATLRNRPTLKPSTSIVSKASEFIDIYRYPPSRPEPIYPTPQVDKTAAKCRKDVCLLPDCSCGGKEIPGDLPPEDTPQIVLLTFDDSVNDLNKGLYSDLFEKGRTNPNGCPIAATFYVSHEWTDYSQVQNLYASGHEIASHSVSHSFGEQFSVKKWTREIAGQREILAAYGGVKQEDIRGMRAPFLAIGGNKMFKMLYDSNFTYDSSMPVYENKPPSWPYTLDYKVFHDCMIPPCPTRSYPGVWEVPMVMWQDLNGGRCSMGDACSNPPTSDGVYKMLIKNFERHFTSNRSPFGLFYHAAWFTQPHHKEGFIAFLDTITKMPEVWLVTNWQAVQWVRDPTPISRLNNFAPFQCNYPERPRRCNNPKVCNLWHKSGVRYMRTCQPCPDIYPWTGKTGVRNSRVDNEIITE